MPQPRGSTLQAGAALLFGTAVVVLLYSRFLDGFLWDDDFAWVASGRNFDPAWTFGFTQRTHFYRPLVDVYFDLMFALAGYAPRVLHAANVALHVSNVWLLFAIGRRVLRSSEMALAAAFCFAVLPGIIDTIAWVSAVTALQMTLFYLLAIAAHLEFLDSGRRGWRVLSLAAFVGALLSHEGAVTLLPMLMATEWCCSRQGGPEGPALRKLRSYIPFAVVLAAYLAIAFTVNRQNYVVTEGHYRVGLHAVRNLLDYVTTFYVGRRNLAGYVTTAAILVAAAGFGSRAARFAVLWIVVTLAPYTLFTTPGTERYGYLAAVGFALLLGAMMQLALDQLRARAGDNAAFLVTSLLTFVLVARFLNFTVRGASEATNPGEPYRAWRDAFRAAHPTLPTGAVLQLEDPGEKGLDARAFQPMLQLEYGDPALQVEVAGSAVGQP